MTYTEEEYLQLSGLQHFAFCRRQWALIHIEKQWSENLRTVEGHLLHEKAHDLNFTESRDNLKILRGVSVHSPSLGVSGQCDVLEYRHGSGKRDAVFCLQSSGGGLCTSAVTPHTGSVD